VDSWKFFDITHADHVYCNPLSPARLEELISLLSLPPSAHVLDVGCGRAEMLIRLAERYAIRGVGIDQSPYAIKRARDEAARRRSEGSLVFFHQDGAEYFAPQATFDLGVCLGASWIFNGYVPMLRTLARMVKPGGQILVGQPYWIRPPDPAYLVALGHGADFYTTHAENIRAAEREGLAPLIAFCSAPEDWDRYEGLQWRAAHNYSRREPEDPDLVALLSRVGSEREAYLTWGRDTLGWAMYLFGR
jgi:SAM-dependent methyltransferase